MLGAILIPLSEEVNIVCKSDQHGKCKTYLHSPNGRKSVSKMLTITNPLEISEEFWRAQKSLSNLDQHH